MTTAVPGAMRAPAVILCCVTAPRPEKRTFSPRLSSTNSASFNPMPRTSGITPRSPGRLVMTTFERLSTATRPQPVRLSNEARGDRRSATRRTCAMSPPFIRSG